MKIMTMTKIIGICLLIFALVSCEASKNSTKDENYRKIEMTKIVLEKISMGGNEMKEITKSEILTSKMVRGGEKIENKSKLASKNWERLVKLVESLDLNEIQNWEGPTQGRFVDAAKATTIILEVNGQEYYSQGFDEGQPPAQLKELYNFLETL